MYISMFVFFSFKWWLQKISFLLIAVFDFFTCNVHQACLAFFSVILVSCYFCNNMAVFMGHVISLIDFFTQAWKLTQWT